MKNDILITGTNRGLGLALVKLFLESGNTVYALYRTMSKDLKQLKNKFQSNLYLYQVDVTKENNIQNALSKIKNKTNSIDIL
ncbi:MAG: SDR family NAD(P)-dependent oxidoreductase, partial [Candidatus Hermodarchaeota archaeon]